MSTVPGSGGATAGTPIAHAGGAEVPPTASDGVTGAPDVPTLTARSRPPVAERGRTTVEDAVIEKIAGQAAFEIDEVGGTSHRLLGVTVPGGRSGPTRPKVTAKVDGGIARLGVSVSVRYPSPIRQVSAAVRSRVADTVGRLAAVDVREVDVDVVALPHDRAEHRRVM